MSDFIIVKTANGRMHLSRSDRTLCGLLLAACVAAVAFTLEPGSDFGSHINDCFRCVTLRGGE